VKFQLPSIYPITDVKLSGLSHSEQIRRFGEAGAKLVQVREKHLSSAEFLADAQGALLTARAHGIATIINDRVDIAMVTGADGVHLGQDDIPVEAARSLLGPNAIIGISTHDLEQARRAAELPIDYIAFGPIFGTSTKTDPGPAVGLGLLRKARHIVGKIPLVAIGGITRENLEGVLEAGADSAAIIGDLAADPSWIASRIMVPDHRIES
jgi:thiamine-phosphate diphosphorylase